MKHVFPTAEIFHLFAHKRRDDIRNAQSNVSIDGDTLFSYRMPIARHLPTATLIRSGSSTPTTNKHLHFARRAMVGRVIHVVEINDDPTGALITEARECIKNAAKPRIQPATRERYWGNAHALLNDARFLSPRDKHIPALPEANDKETVQAFAVKLLRDDYRATIKVEAEAATYAAKRARQPAADNVYGIENRMYAAHNAYNHGKQALEAAKAISAKPPAGMAALVKEMDALGKTLQAELNAAKRDDMLNSFELAMTNPAPSNYTLAAMRQFHESLAPTDPTHEDTAKRDARLQQTIDAFNTRAATALDLLIEAAERNVTEATLEALEDAPVFFRAAWPEQLAERFTTLQPAINAFKHAQAEANIIKWRAGENVSLPHGIGPLLRLSKDCSTIETSWGARVPASIAPMVWRAANACRASNTAQELPHPRPALGHYKLDSITAHGNIKAGCHVIAFSELALIAPLVGLS